MLRYRAFQDFFPGNRCFGCGPSNPIGHRIKSFWRDDKMEETICAWYPGKRFSAVTREVLHGGSFSRLCVSIV